MLYNLMELYCLGAMLWRQYALEFNFQLKWIRGFQGFFKKCLGFFLSFNGVLFVQIPFKLL